MTDVVVTTAAISCAKLQSNHHHQQTNTQFFYRPDALPVTKPAASEHWRGKSFKASSLLISDYYYYQLLWVLMQISCLSLMIYSLTIDTVHCTADHFQYQQTARPSVQLAVISLLQSNTLGFHLTAHSRSATAHLPSHCGQEAEMAWVHSGQLRS